MNCCLTFLFYNSIAGIFVFLVLGIFTVADNPFLILMNYKEIDGKKEYGKTERKHAFAQYFIAAGFNILFAFTIWYIPSMIELLKNGKGTKKPIRKKSELQTIKEEDEKISNNNNDNNIIKENTNSDINTNSDDNFAINNTNSGLSLGMKET